MRKQRIVIAVIATAAMAGCFLPCAHVPFLAPVHFLHVARKIALGLFVLILAWAVLGERIREIAHPMQVGSSVAGGLIVLFCLYRILVLNVHTLPTFDEDDPRGGIFYQKACDAGEMAGCAMLGKCYWSGSCGLVKDGAHGVGLLQMACDGGSFGACAQLGVCYEFGGCGLGKNGLRAVSLYEKACAGGEMDTCNNLGGCYHEGQCGLSKDDRRAAELFRKACKGGDSAACHNLTILKQ
jgi:hypothetical protein